MNTHPTRRAVLLAGAAAVFASRETAVWYWAALVCACAAAISRVADLTVAATAPTPATNAKMPAISVFPAIRISPKNQAVADVFVQWTFENAQFSDGGALTGFDFDATIGAVTDWSVAFPGRLAIPRNHEIKFQTCFTIGASEERLKRHERIES